MSSTVPAPSKLSIFVCTCVPEDVLVLTDTRDLARKLAALEAELKSRLDVHEVAIVDVLQRIMEILNPPPPPPDPPKRQIGFHARPDDGEGEPAKDRRR